MAICAAAGSPPRTAKQELEHICVGENPDAVHRTPGSAIRGVPCCAKGHPPSSATVCFFYVAPPAAASAEAENAQDLGRGSPTKFYPRAYHLGPVWGEGFASQPGSSAADATYGSPKKKNNNKGQTVALDSPDCGLPDWHPGRDGTRSSLRIHAFSPEKASSEKAEPVD